MHVMTQGYGGLSVLIGVNADRVFMLCAVVAALLGGAYMASHLAPLWAPWQLGPVTG